MSAQMLQIPRHAGRSNESADRLEIAQWTTAPEIDLWPGRTVLTVRVQGCPWHCTTCEQPELRDTVTGGAVLWHEVRDVLLRSRGVLEGVVFSGGEPTRQSALVDAIVQIREIGIPVALHTSGAYPRLLAEVLPLVDRVVLDVRAPAMRYRAVTGTGLSAHKVFASLRAVLESGVELQVRSCIDPDVVSAAEVAQLRVDLAAQGVRDHVVVERQGQPRSLPSIPRVPVGSGRLPVRR